MAGQATELERNALNSYKNAAMTRRERLMATLGGRTVDRPPVSFYELDGLNGMPPDGSDPFYVYSHPSWRPLLELVREKVDRIAIRGAAFQDLLPDPLAGLARDVTWIDEHGSRITRREIAAGRRTLTMRTRRDPDVDTVWTVEHLLKDVDDLDAFLELPEFPAGEPVNPTTVLKTEAELGEAGIVMIDIPDPLHLSASLFELGRYTIIATTEPRRFRRLLDRFFSLLMPKIESVAHALPGRLWRITGPEYAAAPYLRPPLFREYVCRYAGQMVDAIHETGGYARIHCHGNTRAILQDMADTGADAIDPIEPPPQGDVELREVRRRFGDRLVLFGNLEIADIETMPTGAFAEKVKRALEEGTSGTGRGFVLMPSSAPYGRVLAPRAVRNYEKIIELVEAF